MTLDDRVEIPPQVMSRTVADEVVVLDLAAGTYFGLDPVGARIWQLMAEGQTLRDISEQMLAEYEVARDELERDVLRLAAELHDQQLIRILAVAPPDDRVDTRPR